MLIFILIFGFNADLTAFISLLLLFISLSWKVLKLGVKWFKLLKLFWTLTVGLASSFTIGFFFDTELALFFSFWYSRALLLKFLYICSWIFFNCSGAIFGFSVFCLKSSRKRCAFCSSIGIMYLQYRFNIFQN